MIDEEFPHLSLITELSVNNDGIDSSLIHFQWKLCHKWCLLENALTRNGNEGKIMLKDEIFEDVSKLNDEEIEQLDKVFYNEEIYDKRCPVCLNEHLDDELLVITYFYSSNAREHHQCC